MRMFLRAAAIAALAAGCGKVKNPGAGGVDGAPGDGGDDTDAAVPGPVTVTVYSHNGLYQPKAGVPVVFFQPDGTALATETTDADGVASADLLPGGAVIAFDGIDPPAGASGQLAWAVVGLKPGDHIPLGGGHYSGEPTESMTIQLPAMPESTLFAVITPCGYFESGTRDVVVQFYDWCDDSPTDIIGYTFVGEDRLVVTDDDITIDGGTTHPVSGDWGNTATPDVTVEGLDEVAAMAATWPTGRVGAHGLRVSPPGPVGDPFEDVTGDSLTQTPLKVPQPDFVLLDLLFRNVQQPLGTQEILQWREGDGDVDPVIVDLAELELPWVGSPVYDPTTRVLGWPQVGEGDWDATYLDVFWYAGGKGGPSGEWRVMGPPGVHQVVLPPVPEEFEAWVPSEITSLYPQVILFDSDQHDWDSARQLGFELRVNDHADHVEPPATIRYSSSPSFD
jgi:hypothetical protein